MFAKLITILVAASAVSAVPAHLGRRAVSFSQIDISRLSGDGTAAEANAAKVCPSSLSTTDLEAIRRVAEDAEKSVFNAALAKTTDSATKAAIQCQKDRNKVLKNHCQLVKAQLQNDAAQIAENTKQLTKNRGDVTTRCANVDTSKFIGSGATGGANNAVKTTTKKTKTTKTKTAKATTTAAAASGNTGSISFASIDISRENGDGTDASNDAKAICPSNLGAARLEAIRKVAENAELTFFNPAIAATSDKAALAAIKCQKNRNKVLKNTCQLIKAQIQNDQAQIDENTKQLAKNTADVTSGCANVDTSKFIVA